MLTHQVLLKYQPNTPAAHIDEFCSRMLTLKSLIPEIESLEIGVDELREARSWDLVLMMTFQSIGHLRTYQKHPEHIAVMQFNDPCVSNIAAIDFHTIKTIS